MFPTRHRVRNSFALLVWCLSHDEVETVRGPWSISVRWITALIPEDSTELCYWWLDPGSSSHTDFIAGGLYSILIFCLGSLSLL